MMAALDRTLLGEVSGFIAERMGLHFPEERWPDLARGLKTAGQELGFEYPDACVCWLRSGELTTRQIETLASHLAAYRLHASARLIGEMIDRRQAEARQHALTFESSRTLRRCKTAEGRGAIHKRNQEVELSTLARRRIG